MGKLGGTIHFPEEVSEIYRSVSASLTLIITSRGVECLSGVFAGRVM